MNPRRFPRSALVSDRIYARSISISTNVVCGKAVNTLGMRILDAQAVLTTFDGVCTLYVP